MLGRSTGIALAFNALLIAAAGAETPVEQREIRASGRAKTSADAFKAAREDALEIVAAEALSRDFFSTNQDVTLARLAPAAETLIKSYRLLGERSVGDEAQVEISAVVSASKLRDELSRGGILFARV